jgi:hypothetical protein
MMHGTAPPPPRTPPPDPNPHDENRTMSTGTSRTNEYNEDELWMDPPEYSPPGPVDTEKHSRRTANHSAYRINGHPTIWKNYIYYGFYMYDDCNDFLKAWKATVHDRLERQRFIWREYHYRRINNITISDTLLKRVTEKTIPYLKEHDLDFWLASDMEYEEVKFFNDSSKNISNPPENAEWQEVSPKRRSKKSTPPTSRNTSPHSTTRIPHSPPQPIEAAKVTMTSKDTLSPMPVGRKDTIDIDSEDTPPRRTSQPHNPYAKRTTIQNPEAMDIDQQLEHKQISQEDSHRNPKSLNPTTAAPHSDNDKHHTDLNSHRTGSAFISGNSTVGHGSHQKSTHTHMSTSTPINDGTYRLTVRWKPANYADIYANQERWDQNITETLADVFGEYTETLNLIKWDDTAQINKSSIENVKASGDIRKFISPRITHLESSEQFIFGVRISIGDSTPSRWINDRRTKRVMQENSIAINISNSKTNSGEVITAGHILLKHPEYTHRTYYLMSLRRSLPETTPFFDIGLVYTTPHGEKIPHLIVKCGSNHATSLTEILSAHLDGKKTTALFLATTMLKTMTTEEAHGLFATHKQFTSSIQRLPLFPQVINIDRVRTEYNLNSSNMERTTREWATGLRSKETGNLLQCDAENGGKDKRAYLLVPTVNLDQVKYEYETYKHRLKQRGSFRNNQSSPDNLCATTEDRPQEIYVPTAAVLRNLQFMQNMSSESIWKAAPPTVRPRPTPPTMQQHSRETNQANTATQATPFGGQYHRDQTKPIDSNQPIPTKQTQGHSRTPPSDEATTICTTQSPLTRNTQTQSTISALEETIQRQQHEIRNMLHRFNAMDTKMEHLTTAIKTGELNHNNSILQIQQQLDKVCTSLTYLVQQTTLNQNRNQSQFSPNATTPIHPTQAEPDKPRLANTDFSGSEPIAKIDENTTITRPRSPIGLSPEKKKPRPSVPNEQQLSDEQHSFAEISIPMTLEEEEFKTDTDQRGAQYKRPSPSDGGNPD